VVNVAASWSDAGGLRCHTRLTVDTAVMTRLNLASAAFVFRHALPEALHAGRREPTGGVLRDATGTRAHQSEPRDATHTRNRRDGHLERVYFAGAMDARTGEFR
jgi:hypothetical protein